jgi:hypothetical protein
MPKFNIEEIYGDRLKQIDKEIKVAIRKKHWGIKKMLENEKIEINKCLNKECAKEV